MTTVIFHDFPGLKNSFLKFHDFPGCMEKSKSILRSVKLAREKML